ncbi:hypothetical protein DFQ28_000381, partial [Apophysomyces sp. BC1034]
MLLTCTGGPRGSRIGVGPVAALHPQAVAIAQNVIDDPLVHAAGVEWLAAQTREILVVVVISTSNITKSEAIQMDTKPKGF